jgi:hypothetical protein
MPLSGYVARAREQAQRVLQFLTDLIRFLRDTPSVMMAMTVEEHLRVGASLTFWALVFIPMIVAPIVFLVLWFLGIPFPRLPFS